MNGEHVNCLYGQWLKFSYKIAFMANDLNACKIKIKK